MEPQFNKFDFIRDLKKLDGAIPYDGDASVQVVFILANGKTLRFGITDEDISDGNLWFDQYPGLLNEFSPLEE